jgi:hypothetical protein
MCLLARNLLDRVSDIELQGGCLMGSGACALENPRSSPLLFGLFGMKTEWYLSLSWRRFREQGFRRLVRKQTRWEEEFFPVLPGLWIVRITYT